MEHDTFRNKLSKLTQKTRKALRLYSSPSNAAFSANAGERGSARNHLSYTSNTSNTSNTSKSAFKSSILKNQTSPNLSLTHSTSHSFEFERSNDSIDYSVLQVQQWREVTRDLLQKITPLLTVSSNRKLVVEFYGVRDQFYNEWRLLQADLHTRQLELEAAAESGEFVKCVDLSVDLVALKARMQACQAAHNELQRIIENSKVSSPTSQEMASQEMASQEMAAHDVESQRIEEESEVAEELPHYDPDDSNVIPLRRRNY